MKAISFKTALSQLTSDQVKIKTLGRKSAILVSKEGANALRIENSKGKVKVIDEEHWRRVEERVNNLDPKQRHKTSRYAHGERNYNWINAPDRVFSPYIPAIMKHLQ